MNSRLQPLEGCRGIAAIVVLVHHFFLGFAPLVTGRLDTHRNEDSLVGSAGFVLVNGNAAVLFFFSLSGFVLTWSYFRQPDALKLKRAMIKRWPRLAGIVTLMTVTTYFMFASDLFAHKEAAALSGSPWLESFAGSGHRDDFKPSLTGAVVEGTTTFVTGRRKYNANLWTMRPEFLGSMLIFLLAPYYLKSLVDKRARLILAVAAIAASALSKLMIPFLAGAALSLFFTRRTIALHWTTGATLMLAGLYCLGYYLPTGDYRWLAGITAGRELRIEFAMHLLGSLALIAAIVGTPALFRAFDGETARQLGRLSFPLYLCHTMAICSVGSWTYIELTQQGAQSQLVLGATFAVTLVATLLACIPALKFDEWWVEKTDRWTKNRTQAKLPT